MFQWDVWVFKTLRCCKQLQHFRRVDNLSRIFKKCAFTAAHIFCSNKVGFLKLAGWTLYDNKIQPRSSSLYKILSQIWNTVRIPLQWFFRYRLRNVKTTACLRIWKHYGKPLLASRANPVLPTVSLVLDKAYSSSSHRSQINVRVYYPHYSMEPGSASGFTHPPFSWHRLSIPPYKSSYCLSWGYN